MHNLRIFSIFSGIGGLELGLEMAGLGKTVGHAEIDPFCSEILEHHWPGIPNFGDVHNVTGNSVPEFDILCGGFPCQPVSLAGKGLAQEDPRWLWPQFERIIDEYRPSWVIAENVPGLRKRGLGDVLRGLANVGYDAEWVRLSAAAVGAPHLRERLFIVAYPGGQDSQGDGARNRSGHGGSPGVASDPNADSQGRGYVGEHAHRGAPGGVQEQQAHGAHSDGLGASVADSAGARLEGRVFTEAARAALPFPAEGTGWSTEPDVGRVASRIPRRVDRLKALGNSVVPQCAEFVGLCIRRAIEDERS